MFNEAVAFVLDALNGAVDVLTDLNTVAPIIGIALVGFLILTAVTRLLLPIIGGTLPSGMADSVDLKTGRMSSDEYGKRHKNYAYKKSRDAAYSKARDLRTYDRRYRNRTDN